MNQNFKSTKSDIERDNCTIFFYVCQYLVLMSLWLVFLLTNLFWKIQDPCWKCRLKCYHSLQTQNTPSTLSRLCTVLLSFSVKNQINPHIKGGTLNRGTTFLMFKTKDCSFPIYWPASTKNWVHLNHMVGKV